MSEQRELTQEIKDKIKEIVLNELSDLPLSIVKEVIIQREIAYVNNDLEVDNV